MLNRIWMRKGLLLRLIHSTLQILHFWPTTLFKLWQSLGYSTWLSSRFSESYVFFCCDNNTVHLILVAKEFLCFLNLSRLFVLLYVQSYGRLRCREQIRIWRHVVSRNGPAGESILLSVTKFRLVMISNFTYWRAFRFSCRFIVCISNEFDNWGAHFFCSCQPWVR